MNGVLIAKDLHRYFHRLYGTDVSPLELTHFLKTLKENQFEHKAFEISLLEQQITELNLVMKKTYSI
jgi:hypothetical protein